MKSGISVNRLATTSRSQVVDLTSAVRRIVRESGVVSGLAVVFVPHTTAGITVNENYDPDVKHDVLAKLDRLVPAGESGYRHAEGNSDSHLKAAMVGSSVSLMIAEADLVLGRWQGVWFCEFDGPRDREVWVKVMAG